MDTDLLPYSPTALISRAHCRLTADDDLVLHFDITGELDQFLWPDEHDLANEGSDLWQHTCFEYFIGHVNEPGYHEFNQSTSGNFAGYAFNAYRQDKTSSDLAIADEYHLTLSPERCQLRLVIPAIAEQFYLGVAVVLEDINLNLHYFAPAHPADGPDFHLREHHTLIDTSHLRASDVR